LLLKCSYALGDVVVLTGAVRDLHRAYPGEFQVHVQTSCQPLWWYNPHVRPPNGADSEAQIIDCNCPLISASNRLPAHVLHGCTDFLAAKLGITLAPLEFHGDIHLSKSELKAPSPVTKYLGRAVPYWLILGGGKSDLTIKWWSHERYQAVVDHFRGHILFVQLGRLGDHHPRLRGTLDLRGGTTIRELVNWVYHAQGVVCGVTGLMHLAAAVPRPHPEDGLRPCVVIAGGREPPHWEAYPGHRFLHTVGSLPCCQNGGCWRSRTKALGDGLPYDAPERLCLDVVGRLPRCMDQITAKDVIRHIENFLVGKELPTLSRASASRVQRRLRLAENGQFDALTKGWRRAPRRAAHFLANIPPYPRGRFSGRGIVMCAGGVDYFANAWASLHILRESGCQLPVELWHAGPAELDDRMRKLIEPLGVRCVDAFNGQSERVRSALRRFAIKPYAILHSSFREVFLLDADNLVVRNPEGLFEDAGYRKTGALFWPDFGRFGVNDLVWRLCGVPYRDEPEFETGQLLVHKFKCWQPLNLAWHYNEQAYLYYRVIYGDKDTFHMAFRKTGHPYAMPGHPVRRVGMAMIQHDAGGERLFEHLTFRKLRFRSGRQMTRPVAGLIMYGRALWHLRRLRRVWDGKIG
jgi:ADP-heptose:LPS heptosyltransferase